jgi:hypothetical protein
LNEWSREALVQDCPPTVAQTLLEQAYLELGVRVTRPIYQLMVHSTIGVVLNAIAAVKERLTSKTAAPVKSKEGLLTTAIRRHFTPNKKQRVAQGAESGVGLAGAFEQKPTVLHQ